VVGLCNVTSVMVGLCQVAFNGSEKSTGHGKQQSARASCRRCAESCREIAAMAPA
jgi:hypothetical protein